MRATRIIPVLALSAAMTWPLGQATAFDLTALSDAERAAFGEEVRAYLLANPQVLIEVSQALESQQAAAQAEGDQSTIAANAAEIFADKTSFVGGNPEGSLTVVEFIDYRCGYCRKAHGDVAELVKSDGDIRYVVKEFPILGEESLLASQFAIAALQTAGPEAYEKINAGFYESFRGDVTLSTLGAFAEDLGLDPAPILAAMDTPAVTSVINDNHLLGQRLDISGTPTFIIGGQMVRGYVPLRQMRAIVEDERS
ncbi:MAG: DsbA family protein [Paracoccaceae bacterium]